MLPENLLDPRSELAGPLLHLASLRSEIRALQGAIQQQHDQRSTLRHAAEELRSEMAGISRSMDMRRGRLTALRARQTDVDALADSISEEARATTTALRRLQRVQRVEAAMPTAEPADDILPPHFRTLRAVRDVLPAEREAQLQAARERMRRRGMLGDIAARAVNAHLSPSSGMVERVAAMRAPPEADDGGWLRPPPLGEPKMCCDALDAPLPDVCSICLDVRDAGERVATLECTHAFHEKCVRRWLETSVGCPTCRAHVPRVRRSDDFNLKLFKERAAARLASQGIAAQSSMGGRGAAGAASRIAAAVGATEVPRRMSGSGHVPRTPSARAASGGRAAGSGRAAALATAVASGFVAGGAASHAASPSEPPGE